jgi:hypothetical protein
MRIRRRRRRCPSRQNPSNFFGNKANVTPQTIDATRARDRRETQEEREEELEGRGEPHKQASRSSVW